MKRLILAAAAVFTTATAASSQTDPMMLSSIPVHDLSLDGGTRDVLAALAEKYHVVIGVYGTSIGAESNAVHLLFKSGTLGEVFEAIVRADPRLEWKQAGNGAFHFVYRGALLPLFGITVHSIDLEQPTKAEASGRLSQIPEVAGWLRDHGCAMDEWIAGRRAAEWGKFIVHSRDSALPALFDEIAAKSGTYFWSAIQYSAAPCAISVRP